jgi:DNA-binding response OmpR family regulator
MLIVDDEPVQHRFVEIRASLPARYRGGDEVVMAMRDRPAGLLPLHMNIRGMGGIEVCRRIRAAFTNTSALMIGASDSEDDAMEALEAGGGGQADSSCLRPCPNTFD